MAFDAYRRIRPIREKKRQLRENLRQNDAFQAAHMLLPCAILLLAPWLQSTRTPHSEPEIHSLFGTSVAGLGDIDSDGVPDFLIADPGEPGPGRVWAISGRTSRVIYTCDGVAPGDYFGWRLRAVGDVNGDGFNDWIAGCDGPWKFNEGRDSFASVHSGRDGSLLHLIHSIDHEEELGRCFATAGDIDGDGKEDLVIGARRSASSGISGGVAYLYSGATGARIRAIGKRVEIGTTAYDVANLGDCDGDGVPDILIALRPPTEDTSTVRTVALFSGASGDELWRFETHCDQYIEQVRAAGDIDEDGSPDALLSCLGSVLLLSGRDGRLIRTLAPEDPPFLDDPHVEWPEDSGFGSAITVLRNPIGLLTLAVGGGEFSLGTVYYFGLSYGFRVPPIPTKEDWTLFHPGWNLDDAGDLDGDGWDDLLCATFSQWGGGNGQALVYSGKDRHELRRFERHGDGVALVPSPSADRR